MGLREKIFELQLKIEEKKQKYNDFKLWTVTMNKIAKKKRKKRKEKEKKTKTNLPHDSKHSMFYDWIHWAQKYRTLLCTSSINISSLNNKLKTW